MRRAVVTRVATVALALATALVLANCDDIDISQPAPSASTQPTGASDGGAETPSPETAKAQLSGLAVKGKSGDRYDPDAFHWKADVDKNGCDTRNDSLRRDLTDITFKQGTNGCKVATGTLLNPYSGDTIQAATPDTLAKEIQIEHMVARKDACNTGACTPSWDDEKRTAFANDPLNLTAVSSKDNQAKSDSNAAEWLPPDKSYRCTYISRQIAVKAKYGLWVTQPEHDAMSRVLDSCPGFPVATEDGLSWPAPGAGHLAKEGSAPKDAEPAPPETAPAAEGQPREPSEEGATYANCKEARAAGAAPLHRGQPGYSEGMDGDGDGVACE